MRPWRALLVAALVAALVGCTGDDGPGDGDAPGATASPGGEAAPENVLPDELAEPVLDPLWLDTLGLPVVAAVRTSTALARMADLDDAARAARCRTVAAELEEIGPPELLVGLAITADEETATLLVADIQAKAELLTVCLEGGDALDALVAEVARTHATAVAWVAELGS